VVWSFVYLALGRVLELIMLCCQSAEAKEIEILVLRHEPLADAAADAVRRWADAGADIVVL